MTTRLTTPWWRPRRPEPTREAAGSCAPTAVLDHTSDAVRALAARTSGGDDRQRLQSAHGLIAAAVRPVYALDERQSASVTLRKGRGSCSQRMAVLEATARSLGIATRCRGLLVDGRFWYPRFPRLQRFVPDVVVLAWPEFQVDGVRVTASHLFGTPDPATATFTNQGEETLFDALARGAVTADLAGRVVADLGRFDSRDELFRAHGQTLHALARVVVDPVTSRSAARRAAGTPTQSTSCCGPADPPRSSR